MNEPPSHPKNTKDNLKRGYPQRSSPTPVKVEENSQTVQELQTQIAILQRELAKQTSPKDDLPTTP